MQGYLIGKRPKDGVRSLSTVAINTELVSLAVVVITAVRAGAGCCGVAGLGFRTVQFFALVFAILTFHCIRPITVAFSAVKVESSIRTGGANIARGTCKQANCLLGTTLPVKATVVLMHMKEVLVVFALELCTVRHPAPIPLYLRGIWCNMSCMPIQAENPLKSL